MSKLPALFGIHNHQPLGNFDHVMEKLTETCYRPFLEAIGKAPWLPLNFHASGILLSWWEQNEPSMIKLIGTMVEEKRMELLTGGFFEPVLAAIPRHDRREQIGRHSDYLYSRFGVRPKGLWLAERVWESDIIEDLVEAGITYVLVDDRHFLISGFKKEELHGYYITESGGKSLSVFPIDETLRYFIPFRPAHEIGGYLREVAGRGEMAIYSDDGEKFGGWPKTRKWVYEDGWLESFLEASEKWTEDFLEWTTFSNVMRDHEASGICYLPTASYEEMEEWALPSESLSRFEELLGSVDPSFKKYYRPFLRGGHWKNFFVKYPESNHLHKRVLEASNLSAADFADNEPVRTAVLGAQCNDPYWHGIFGGLYLPHLRNAVWESLLRSEAMMRSSSGTVVFAADINYDGHEEIVMRSENITFIFLPHCGGQLAECSLLDPPHNYANTVTRREEAYHHTLRRLLGEQSRAASSQGSSEGVSSIHDLDKDIEPDILDHLVYDWYGRHSFIEHLFDPTAEAEEFRKCAFREWGDFANQPFSWKTEQTAITFSRNGGVFPPGSGRVPFTIDKKFAAADKGRRLKAAYRLENRSSERITCRFGVEWNLFPAFLVKGNGELFSGGRPLPLDGIWERKGNEITVIDDAIRTRLTIRLQDAAVLWGFPVQTVSQTESGYERTTQGFAAMAIWDLDLWPGQDWKQEIEWRLTRRNNQM